FMQAADPVRIGLVDSLNRPGGNVTGVNLMWAEVAGKRLDLLLQLVPRAKSIAYLRNPTNPVFAESEARVLQAAADAYAIRLLFVNASRPSEFETAFADLVQQNIAPVARLARGPGVMEVNPMFPAKTVPEFIAYAKANPGKINMATAGSGSMLHVYGELFKMMAGVDMVPVPYRGAPPAV